MNYGIRVTVTSAITLIIVASAQRRYPPHMARLPASSSPTSHTKSPSAATGGRRRYSNPVTTHSTSICLRKVSSALAQPLTRPLGTRPGTRAISGTRLQRFALLPWPRRITSGVLPSPFELSIGYVSHRFHDGLHHPIDQLIMFALPDRLQEGWRR